MLHHAFSCAVNGVGTKPTPKVYGISQPIRVCFLGPIFLSLGNIFILPKIMTAAIFYLHIIHGQNMLSLFWVPGAPPPSLVTRSRPRLVNARDCCRAFRCPTIFNTTAQTQSQETAMAIQWWVLMLLVRFLISVRVADPFRRWR